MRKTKLARAVALTAGFAAVQSVHAANFKTDAEEQMYGLGDWSTEALFTIEETVTGYTPPGIPDGIGAIRKNPAQARALVNHELNAEDGYAYSLANGTTMTGARVSVFTFDAKARKNNDKVGIIKQVMLAYDTVYDRYGVVVTDPNQINEQADPTSTDGFDRLCSATIFEAGTFNLEDDIFVTNEETSAASGHPHGGSYWMLDVAGRNLWAAPDLGRGSWESATFVDPGDDDKVAMILGDDRQASPLYLYIGEKDQDGNFLARNGLSGGQLYVWVADEGARSPEDWNGTGTARSGTFVPIDAQDVAMANMPGYDGQGYKDDVTLRAEATGDAASGGLEGFAFSRPEDVATNPEDGTQVVMASTGRESVFPADSWGTTYLIDLDFGDGAPTAEITILYDGDDAGRGTIAGGPDNGLRSPDNLEWASDGQIYIQEDRSFGGFCEISTEEASIWKLDPTAFAGSPLRIAQINRLAALPDGQTDGDPTDCGDWESSGIEEVTHLFPTEPGQLLFLFDVQAHSVRDGSIGGREDLVQGGQILFLTNQ